MVSIISFFMKNFFLKVVLLSLATMLFLRKLMPKVKAQSPDSNCTFINPIFFEYNSFADTDFETLQVYYDAYIDDITKSLRLTRSNPAPTSPSGESDYRGQIFYKQAIQFMSGNVTSPMQRILSFNTAFSFFLLPADGARSAEGFIFFLMTDPSKDVEEGIPLYFGALPENNITNTKIATSIIAIEYDTTQNFEVNDVDNDHVGLDINSAVSLVQLSAYQEGVLMSDGTTKYAWIDYFQFNGQLELRLSNNPTRPDDPLLRYGINLGAFYTDTMFVGFSAETNTEFPQTFAVKSWSFTTFLEPYTATPTNSSPVYENPGTPPTISDELTTWIHKSYVFGKIAGVTVGVVLMVILICGGFLGFTHFGFSCVATQEDLIELERDLFGDFGKDESKIKIEKGENLKESVQKSAIQKKIVAPDAAKEGLTAENLESKIIEEKKWNDYDNLYVEDDEGPIVKKGSLWGELIRHTTDAGVASENNTKRKSDAQEEPSSCETKEKKSIVKMIFAKFTCGNGKSGKGKKDNSDKNIKIEKNEKEQIVALIQEATSVAQDEQIEAHRFQWKELNEATEGFSTNRMLHNSPKTHSSTYHGTLQNSKDIVIKVITLKKIPKSKVIKTEMTILSNLHHPNLICFLGWCKRNNKIYIVYQRHHGESLSNILFLSEETSKPVPWSKRFEIITTVANALSYLHHDSKWPKCSGSLKFSNIMIAKIDEDFDLKLVDYGLEWLDTPKAKDNDNMTDEENQDRENNDDNGNEEDNNSHEEIEEEPGSSNGQKNREETPADLAQEISYGFLAPELQRMERPTQSTDIYSFGMLSLEIACLQNLEIDALGERNQKFIDSLHDMDAEGALLQAEFMSDIPKKERRQAELVLSLSLACIAHDPRKRPTMKQLVHCLDEQISLEEALEAEEEHNLKEQEDAKQSHEIEISETDILGKKTFEDTKPFIQNACNDPKIGSSFQLEVEPKNMKDGKQDSIKNMNLINQPNDGICSDESKKRSLAEQCDNARKIIAPQKLWKAGDSIKLYDNASFENFDKSVLMNFSRQYFPFLPTFGAKVWVELDDLDMQFNEARRKSSFLVNAVGRQEEEQDTGQQVTVAADELHELSNMLDSSKALQYQLGEPDVNACDEKLIKSSYFSKYEHQLFKLKGPAYKNLLISWQNECEYKFNQETLYFERLLDPGELDTNLHQRDFSRSVSPHSRTSVPASFINKLDSINDTNYQEDEYMLSECTDSVAGVQFEKDMTHSDSYTIASLSWPSLPCYCGKRNSLSTQDEQQQTVQPTIELFSLGEPNDPGYIEPNDLGKIELNDLGHIEPGDLGHIEPYDLRHIKSIDQGHIEPIHLGHIEPLKFGHAELNDQEHVELNDQEHVELNDQEYIELNDLEHIEPNDVGCVESTQTMSNSVPWGSKNPLNSENEFKVSNVEEQIAKEHVEVMNSNARVPPQTASTKYPKLDNHTIMEKLVDERNQDIPVSHPPLPQWPLPLPNQRKEHTIWPIPLPGQNKIDSILPTLLLNEGINKEWPISNPYQHNSKRILSFWPRCQSRQQNAWSVLPSIQSNNNPIWPISIPRDHGDTSSTWPISPPTQDKQIANMPNSISNQICMTSAVTDAHLEINPQSGSSQ